MMEIAHRDVMSETMVSQLTKLDARRHLRATQRRVEQRAQVFALQLAAVLDESLRRELDRHHLLRKVAGDVTAAAKLRAMITAFGVKEATASAGRAQRIARGTVVTEQLDRRILTLGPVQAMGEAATEKSEAILADNKRAVERAVQEEIRAAAREDPRPDTSELARRIRSRVEGLTQFSFERAFRIARTEMLIAENAGQVTGYELAGVKQIEWLAFQSPIFDRRHDLMQGKRIPIGGRFTLPSGAKMRFPGDPLGPVGDLVSCRCTVAGIVVS